MAAVDPNPASRSRLIRDLAIRGAETERAERERRQSATDYLLSIARGETDYDFEPGPRRSTRSAKPTLAEPFATVPLVVDTSAWVRQREPVDAPALGGDAAAPA